MSLQIRLLLFLLFGIYPYTFLGIGVMKIHELDVNSRCDIKGQYQTPMTTSNMVTLMLHGTLLVLTLITGAVQSKGIGQGLGQYPGWDENPLFPFSTIIRMKEFKRKEMTDEKSKSEEVLYIHFWPFFTIVK
jgi:hypothetical protein